MAGTDQQRWDSVREEGGRMSNARKILLDNAPTSLYDIVDQQTGEREFKNGVSFSWSWSGTPPDRVLTIIVTGIILTTNQKNSIQNKLNERFGISNVIIQNG